MHHLLIHTVSGKTTSSVVWNHTFYLEFSWCFLWRQMGSSMACKQRVEDKTINHTWHWARRNHLHEVLLWHLSLWLIQIFVFTLQISFFMSWWHMFRFSLTFGLQVDGCVCDELLLSWKYISYTLSTTCSNHWKGDYQ